jgi:hypothetical protein
MRLGGSLACNSLASSSQTHGLHSRQPQMNVQYLHLPVDFNLRQHTDQSFIMPNKSLGNRQDCVETQPITNVNVVKQRVRRFYP